MAIEIQERLNTRTALGEDFDSTDTFKKTLRRRAREYKQSVQHEIKTFLQQTHLYGR